MAGKSKAKATTVKSGANTAKNNPLGRTGIRMFGAVLAFIGLMICLNKSAIGVIIQVVGIALCLLGAFVAMSNLRKLLGKSKTESSVALYLIIGILIIIGGVLLILFNGTITTWFYVIVGVLAAIYGLIWLIKTLTGKGAMFKLSVVMSVLTVISGILIALLFLSTIGGNHILVIVFGAIAAAVGGIELLAY